MLGHVISGKVRLGQGRSGYFIFVRVRAG